MTEYLWELQIENIPLGWQETYKAALKDCPDGEIVPMPNMDYENNEIDRFFYHPVGYRNQLISFFNEEKLKAVELLNNKEELGFKKFFNEILKVDTKLFNLLMDWLSPDDYFDGSTFNPKTIKKDLINTEGYFSFDSDNAFYPESYKTYLTLKLVNLED